MAFFLSLRESTPWMTAYCPYRQGNKTYCRAPVRCLPFLGTERSTLVSLPYNGIAKSTLFLPSLTFQSHHFPGLEGRVRGIAVRLSYTKPRSELTEPSCPGCSPCDLARQRSRLEQMSVQPPRLSFVVWGHSLASSADFRRFFALSTRNLKALSSEEQQSRHTGDATHVSGITEGKRIVVAGPQERGEHRFISVAAAEEITLAGGLGRAINERLIQHYDRKAHPVPRRSMSHPFIRPVEGVERRLFVLESQRLLADSFLTAIDPATSAKYVVAIPNEHRAPLPLLIYTYITKHRHHSNTAWKFAHLILERTEAEHLIAAFKIPGGFNGRFYFYMLHLWLVHKRLCLGVNRSMAAETQRNLYLGQRETLRRCKRKTVAESLVTASLGTDSCCPTDQENKSDFFGLNGSEGSLPVPLLHQRVTEDLSGKGTRAGREGQQAHTARQWTYSSELKTALQTGPPGSGAAALIALKELEEEERYLLHGRDELFDEEKVVEGEMIDAALFKITWDVLKDWLQQKHIAEARFEFELRNCQQYAFGFFAGLDEAMTDDEIYAARLKEVLWGNLYSGRISFDDPHLHLLTKYTIRQLTHLMQIHKVYFYRASFSWADFPVSARFPPSRVVPPLAQRVRYGGYVPSLVGDAPSVTAIGGGQISEKLTSGGSDTRRRGIFGRLKQLWRGDSQERSERKN